jgi:predicted flap endonuclease-1-like 5' DNA nuclease
MAVADGRIRELESQQRAAQVDNYITLEPEDDSLPPFLADESDDLQRINGIGPVFSGRLRDAEISTVAGVTAVSPEKLAAILNISERRAASILNAAKQLV